MARLSALLEERRQQYEFSDLTISLEGAGPEAQLGAPAIVVACRCGAWGGFWLVAGGALSLCCFQLREAVGAEGGRWFRAPHERVGPNPPLSLIHI